METKTCRKCNLQKDVNDFRLKKDKTGKYYRYSYCKLCEKECFNNVRKKYDKKYRETHKEEINRKCKERRKKISLEEKEKIKLYMQTYMSNWRSKNKEKIKEYYTKDNKKRSNDVFLHFKDTIRHEILRCFKTKGLVKNKKTEEIINLPLNIFYNYLLQTYKNNYGYEWDGKEKVHIDHIIPLSKAHTEKDVIKLCHYTNLQLLKAKDNLKKYNKLNWELE